MDINKLYKLYLKNQLVDTDTRSIRQGSVFFALKGDNFNGNKYALEALENGADYAVVDEYITNDVRLILVDDVLLTLQKLANHHRKCLGIPILALTGSNGKTTTKELLNVVLSVKYNTHATEGNFNNHIGVPLTLLSMDNTCEFGIVEMGANHHKEIELLSAIVEPDYGYITNFGKAHLEGFGSLEGVIEAKSELYENLIENNKVIFVNSFDENQMLRSMEGNRVFLNSNINLSRIDPFLTIDYDGQEFVTNIIGEYNLNNIRLAITVGEFFDIAKDDIIKVIGSYVSKNNRSQVIKRGNNTIVLDAYNANPSSMEVAIVNFKKNISQNKILILGDMFELGGSSAKEHQMLVDFIEGNEFNSVFLIGENFYKTNTLLHKFNSFKEFESYFKKTDYINSSFLIKGSRGMKLERVLSLID